MEKDGIEEKTITKAREKIKKIKIILKTLISMLRICVLNHMFFYNIKKDNFYKGLTNLSNRHIFTKLFNIPNNETNTSKCPKNKYTKNKMIV
jgi:hypothetical protein